MDKKLVNVYDFDLTIFDGDTEYLFYNYMLTLDEVSDFHKDLIRKILSDLSTFFTRCKYLYFITKDIKDFDKAINDFWDINENKIKDFYLKHRREDDIISSATPRFLLTPIEKRLGLKNLIATELDDEFRLVNLNKSEGKVFNLKKIYPDVEINEFYSDSNSDLPLAYIAKVAYKVNGNEINKWDLPKKEELIDEQDLYFKNNEFKILNLTDIQLSIKEYEKEEIRNHLINEIDYLIKESNPDLITLGGDQVYDGEESILRFLCDLINSYNIPWAPIFGNHDQISYLGYDHLSITEQGLLYKSYDNCLFKVGDASVAYYPNFVSRRGNYIINLKNEDKIVRKLIFVNSGNMEEFDKNNKELANNSNYAKLSDKQVEMIKKASSDKNVPTSLFTHIPPFVYATALNEALKTEFDYFKNPKEFKDFAYKINDLDSYNPNIWNKGYENSFGVMHDSGICCPPINDYVYERLKDTSLDMIIAGHDHTNNTVIKYHNMTLAYGLKTGKTCYYKDYLQGGTLFTIYKDSSFKIKHLYYKK